MDNILLERRMSRAELLTKEHPSPTPTPVSHVVFKQCHQQQQENFKNTSWFFFFKNDILISKRLHQEGFFDSRAHLYLGELLNAPISLQIHSCFEHRVASNNQQHATKIIRCRYKGSSSNSIPPCWHPTETARHSFEPWESCLSSRVYGSGFHAAVLWWCCKICLATVGKTEMRVNSHVKMICWALNWHNSSITTPTTRANW